MPDALLFVLTLAAVLLTPVACGPLPTSRGSQSDAHAIAAGAW